MVYETLNIQYFLNICNYGAPEIDGDYGSETTECVKKAQRAYGISVDGDFGPTTESFALSQIKQYQTQLNSKGFSCDIDGIAGAETFNAVKDFQSANGLSADGIVGENSFPVLFNNSSANKATASTSTTVKVSSSGNSKSLIGLDWGGIDPYNLANFDQSEFKCECGCGGDVTPDLKVVAQLIRNKFGETTISSGARCPSQNVRDGGVTDSLHVPSNNSNNLSHAMDLYCSPMSRSKVDEIANYALSINSGIGVIRYYSSLFVHVQIGRRDTVGN